MKHITLAWITLLTVAAFLGHPSASAHNVPEKKTTTLKITAQGKVINQYELQDVQDVWAVVNAHRASWGRVLDIRAMPPIYPAYGYVEISVTGNTDPMCCSTPIVETPDATPIYAVTPVPVK